MGNKTFLAELVNGETYTLAKSNLRFEKNKPLAVTAKIAEKLSSIMDFVALLNGDKLGRQKFAVRNMKDEDTALAIQKKVEDENRLAEEQSKLKNVINVIKAVATKIPDVADAVESALNPVDPVTSQNPDLVLDPAALTEGFSTESDNLPSTEEDDDDEDEAGEVDPNKPVEISDYLGNNHTVENPPTFE